MPAVAAPLRILAFGDSLTAGFGLAASDAFPAKLADALRAKGYDVQMMNAGISGDTTAGGRARLDWALGTNPGEKPNYAIVELGANDALRGVDPKLTYENLDAILAKLQAAGIKTLLAGMYAPRNMGPDYARQFDGLYPQLQKKYHVPLYPFFLDGVVNHPELTLPDGLHPTAKGVDRIVSGILPLVMTWIGPPLSSPSSSSKKTP